MEAQHGRRLLNHRRQWKPSTDVLFKTFGGAFPSSRKWHVAILPRVKLPCLWDCHIGRLLPNDLYSCALCGAYRASLLFSQLTEYFANGILTCLSFLIWSWGTIVSMVIRPGSRWFMVRERHFTFYKTIQTGSGVHPTSYSVGMGVVSLG